MSFEDLFKPVDGRKTWRLRRKIFEFEKQGIRRNDLIIYMGTKKALSLFKRVDKDRTHIFNGIPVFLKQSLENKWEVKVTEEVVK